MTRETPEGHDVVELHPCGRTNKQTNKHSKWVYEQDDMFTAGIFFCGTVLKHAAILSLDSNGGSTKYLYYT